MRAERHDAHGGHASSGLGARASRFLVDLGSFVVFHDGISIITHNRTATRPRSAGTDAIGGPTCPRNRHAQN